MATSISSALMSCFFYVVVLLILCSLKEDHVVEAKNTNGSFPQTHTLKVSSFLQLDVCDPSPQVFNQGSNLKLVHVYGPCHLRNQEKGANVSSYVEMLLQDKWRAESIQAKARLSKKNSGTGDLKREGASVPAQSGKSLGIGTFRYAVKMGLGTPAKELTFLFDTVTDLSWTQCEPCTTSCYQKDPRFNPANSTSYNNISCSSASCGLINGAGAKSCSASSCHYEYQSGYKYFSGVLATETLTITESQVVTNFLFGCGEKNRGPFGRASGILALGRSNLSLPSQTASKYERLFSYCLPSLYASIGHLTFGGTIPETVKFIPMRNDPLASFYLLDMTGISVGGRLLPAINESFSGQVATIMDSGSLLSRLPRALYSSVREAFDDLMTDYPRVDGYLDSNLCYDFSGYDTVTVPTVSFHFKGGVEVAIHQSGILIGASLTKVCLAFSGNMEDDELAIFAGTQQRTHDVVYDVARDRIGFSPGGCR